MSPPAVHRELIFPNPVEKTLVRPVAPTPITQSLRHTSWLEVHRELDGAIHSYLGAEGSTELSHTYHCLAETFPGLELGSVSACPFESAFEALRGSSSPLVTGSGFSVEPLHLREELWPQGVFSLHVPTAYCGFFIVDRGEVVFGGFGLRPGFYTKTRRLRAMIERRSP